MVACRNHGKSLKRTSNSSASSSSQKPCRDTLYSPNAWYRCGIPQHSLLVACQLLTEVQGPEACPQNVRVYPSRTTCVSK